MRHKGLQYVQKQEVEHQRQAEQQEKQPLMVDPKPIVEKGQERSRPTTEVRQGGGDSCRRYHLVKGRAGYSAHTAQSENSHNKTATLP